MDRKALIAALVPAIASQTPREAGLLASDLVARSWPGGHADRTSPPAIEWVRRWWPKPVTPASLECSCAAGRCRLCN